MIMDGINKYVTEMSGETQENHTDDIGDSTGKLVARARPKQTPSSMLSSPTIPVPYHERKWIDVEQGRFDNICLEVSKLMIRLLQHDGTVPREDEGAVKFQDLASIFRSRITSSSRWPTRTWQSFLQRGGGIKEEIPVLREPQGT